ncbi:MAG: transglycosylase SLT domain-containing protein [Verrucomicrobia bacterium]|nr:transglycosylase SLT domain-containing protein [Verrucomicrobiota bacterium]
MVIRRHHDFDRRLLAGTSLDELRLTEAHWETYNPEALARAFQRAKGLSETDRGILRAAALYRLDPRLLVAVAMRESRMSQQARGAAGEIGMFQIMPNTARHWAQVTGNPVPTEPELFDVNLNAEISAWYLRRGLDAFAHRANPLPFALAYYNAGPSRAQAWERQTPENEQNILPYIPFASTREYVRVITEALQ